MRKHLLFSCLVLAICLASPGSWAKKAFISDSFNISLLKEPGSGKAIIAGLHSGQRLETIETKGDWTLVRVLDGEGKGLEGWILNRYLSSQVPWEKQALILEEENRELKAKMNAMESELNELSLRKLSLAKELEDINKTLKVLQEEYSDLKGGTEDYTAFQVKVERLKDILESSSKDIRKIREENSRLKATEKTRWLMIGALILLCGLILGLIMGRQHKKRRSGVYY